MGTTPHIILVFYLKPGHKYRGFSRQLLRKAGNTESSEQACGHNASRCSHMAIKLEKGFLPYNLAEDGRAGQLPPRDHLFRKFSVFLPWPLCSGPEGIYVSCTEQILKNVLKD